MSTSRSTWKRRERQAAARLGGRRIPVTGERAGADVETPLLSVQVKHGRRRPGYFVEWLAGIRANAAPKGKIGVVVWADHRERMSEAIVLLRLGDFEALHGRVLPAAAQAPLVQVDSAPCLSERCESSSGSLPTTSRWSSSGQLRRLT